VGRLRHEVVKHGGLLLADAARRLSEPDPETRRRTATLLRTRLFGGSGTRGLLAESSDAFDRLASLAREDGVRLDLVHRDPLFSPVARASRILRGSQPSLARLEHDGTTAGSVDGLEQAAALLRSTSGSRMSRLLDEVSSTVVRAADLRSILGDVGAERASGGSPSFEWSGPDGVAVQVDRADWETIWRNLFANALDAGPDVRLGVFAELARDAVTGTPVARFVLADDLPGALTSEMIRGRAADRGWGVVADLVRRHEGSVEVVSPPAGGYRKGIRIDLPALEPEGPA
jgi:signal transduction histidine kinase